MRLQTATRCKPRMAAARTYAARLTPDISLRSDHLRTCRFRDLALCMPHVASHARVAHNY